MPSQKDLIGKHPCTPSIFSDWLACNDVAVTTTKSHRSLTQLIPSNDSKLIDWLGKKIFEHHHSEFRIKKLKENFTKLGFPKYAEQHRKLPVDDKTKKGNATEIILSEYIEECKQKKMIKAYKLRYNANADQAMKGDDTLLIEADDNKNPSKIKLYLGEAKFRKTPDSKVIKDITNSLSKDKKPLSYSYIIDELGRHPDTESLADVLDNFLVSEIKSKGDLYYTGLLLSNENTFNTVEKHLNSNNPNFVLISIGLENPEELIKKSFEHAEYLFKNPDKI